jgi:hypothetical protein
MKKEEWGIPAPLFLCILRDLARQRSGSFPELSNKMNERSVIWRQTIKLSIFITESRLENRFTAGVTKKVRSLK